MPVFRPLLLRVLRALPVQVIPRMPVFRQRLSLLAPFRVDCGFQRGIRVRPPFLSVQPLISRRLHAVVAYLLPISLRARLVASISFGTQFPPVTLGPLLGFKIPVSCTGHLSTRCLRLNCRYSHAFLLRVGFSLPFPCEVSRVRTLRGPRDLSTVPVWPRGFNLPSFIQR